MVAWYSAVVMFDPAGPTLTQGIANREIYVALTLMKVSVAAIGNHWLETRQDRAGISVSKGRQSAPSSGVIHLGR